ncbi:MAG: ABC transporter permease [Ignavibacteriales bacterium]|nr:ABC transporter permease [Ignavibacteriales bacterium]
MKQKVSSFWDVMRREARIIRGDVDIVSIILIAPIFYAFFYGSVYWYKGEHDVAIAVVDMDRSATSQLLTRNLDAHQYIAVTESLRDLGAAEREIASFGVQGAVYIPQGFEASLKSGKGADLKVYLNTSRFLVSNDMNKGVNEVVQTMAAGARVKYFEMQGYSLDQAKEMYEPLRIEVKPLFNMTETYGDFLIPGILALILQQTLLMGLSESIAKERELGTMGELFATAGRSMWALMSGKGAFYLALFSAYAFFFYTVNFAVFSIPFRGSGWALALLTIVFLLSVVYVSFFFSSFFERKMIALQVLGFTSYPIFLISGYSWPLQVLPMPLRLLANTLPITPYVSAYTRIVQMGAGLGDVLPELGQLTVLAICGFIFTRIRMKVLMRNLTGGPVPSPVFDFADWMRRKKS